MMLLRQIKVAMGRSSPPSLKAGKLHPLAIQKVWPKCTVRMSPFSCCDSVAKAATSEAMSRQKYLKLLRHLD